MDQAYIDKLAKNNNGVKRLLVRQDMFDRATEAKGMKTKDSEETVQAFLTMITKRINPRQFGSTGEQNLLEILRNVRVLKENKFPI